MTAYLVLGVALVGGAGGWLLHVEVVRRTPCPVCGKRPIDEPSR